ncbi:MAG: carbohydrate ABC transporter permease [Candidatus Ornithospirochaeta sp.]|nr:carbohydrate ABC transporter permease [Candidatus Ornithospirochaeta sp.]
MEKSRKVKRDKTELLAELIAVLMSVIFMIVILVPVLNTVAKAFSSGNAEVSGTVFLLPKDPQLTTVSSIIFYTDFLLAVWNSVKVTVLGVAISLFVSVLFAYALSSKYLRGKKFFILLCMICMVFKGGMVPTYMVIKGLGLLNSFLSLILPACFSIFNMLVIRNYFDGLPDSVIESASIDGASDFKALTAIVIPMSVPCIATVALLYAVSFWNSYFAPSLYISEPSMITLQVLTRDLVSHAETLVDQLVRTTDMAGALSYGTVAAGITVLGSIPIILAYPMLQKYMTKGMTVGSVKE